MQAGRINQTHPGAHHRILPMRSSHPNLFRALDSADVDREMVYDPLILNEIPNDADILGICNYGELGILVLTTNSLLGITKMVTRNQIDESWAIPLDRVTGFEAEPPFGRVKSKGYVDPVFKKLYEEFWTFEVYFDSRRASLPIWQSLPGKKGVQSFIDKFREAVDEARQGFGGAGS